MPLPTALELPAFQGPLDLLLSLIEHRRLEITEISLAAVTDQYLQAVRALPSPDPDLLAEFLVIGSRLILLKSRALLPRQETPDEDDSIDDLTARLEVYRQFRNIALDLANRFEAGGQAYPHPPRADLQDFQPPLAPIEAEVLARLWRSILRRQPTPPHDEQPLEPRVSVADRVELLRQRLGERGSLDWSEIAGETLDEAIATFLAILELIRRLEARVNQAGRFAPIIVESINRAPVTGDRRAGRDESEQLR